MLYVTEFVFNLFSQILLISQSSSIFFKQLLFPWQRKVLILVGLESRTIIVSTEPDLWEKICNRPKVSQLYDTSFRIFQFFSHQLPNRDYKYLAFFWAQVLFMIKVKAPVLFHVQEKSIVIYALLLKITAFFLIFSLMSSRNL